MPTLDNQVDCNVLSRVEPSCGYFSSMKMQLEKKRVKSLSKLMVNDPCEVRHYKTKTPRRRGSWTSAHRARDKNWRSPSSAHPDHTHLTLLSWSRSLYLFTCNHDETRHTPGSPTTGSFQGADRECPRPDTSRGPRPSRTPLPDRDKHH